MKLILQVVLGILTVILAPMSYSLLAADADLKQQEFFEKRIRPLLISQCYDCHSEGSVESGLRVDSLSALIKGGERGPAVVVRKTRTKPFDQCRES